MPRIYVQNMKKKCNGDVFLPSIIIKPRPASLIKCIIETINLFLELVYTPGVKDTYLRRGL